MKYNDPELVDLLAAQYVLGTLKGLTRKRFQRLMLTSIMAREATHTWEANLNSLSSAIKPVKPDEKVWQQILQRLETRKTPSTVIKTKPGFWRPWSLIATAASLVLAIILLQPVSPIVESTQQFALVENEAKQALWFIDVREQGLSVRASSQLDAISDKDYELWMIVKDQEAPISLGLLPKNGTMLLAKNQQFVVDNINILAVSLEPLGGSPNGSPTEVLYTSKLVTL
jgi:anti-sigma-K factor RskA